jgi:hypothetical protein
MYQNFSLIGPVVSQNVRSFVEKEKLVINIRKDNSKEVTTHEYKTGSMIVSSLIVSGNINNGT